MLAHSVEGDHWSMLQLGSCALMRIQDTRTCGSGRKMYHCIPGDLRRHLRRFLTCQYIEDAGGELAACLRLMNISLELDGQMFYRITNMVSPNNASMHGPFSSVPG